MIRYLLIISLLFNLLFGIFISYKLILRLNKTDIAYKNWYIESRESHFNLLAIDTSDTVFMGASIMQYAEWNEFFPNKKIKNRAVASASANDVKLLIPGILRYQPENIVLMVGYNDLNSGREPQELVNSYNDIISSIDKLSSNTRLIIMSLTPVRQNMSHIQNINARITEANTGIKRLCSKSRCIYLNIHDLLLDSDRQLGIEYTLDGVHLNGLGYRSISEKLQSIL